MTMLQVQLLGRACAFLKGSEQVFVADKRYQCLSYLAYQGEWVSRDELAYLFWPDTATRIARHSLRQLVRRVRALPWLTDFETERDRIRWLVTTDTQALQTVLETQQLEPLMHAYGGSLLAGLDGSDSNEFTRWLEHERQALYSQWRGAMLDHARNLESQTPGQALSVFETLLNHDPLDEDVVRALMRVGLRSGERRRVLETYKSFSANLERDLGLSPTSKMQQLAEQLQNTRKPSVSRKAVADKPEESLLPRPTSSFVGRDLELAEVSHLLGNPECRLLTLTGIGGTGKSRLALRAAEERASHYRGGVVFVPLEALQNADAIPGAIAAALRLAPAGKDDALMHLKKHLGTKRLLLVLDNFEHLLDGAIMLAELLKDCPHLELLVTSRERLNLNEEWLLPVGGLSYPDKPLSVNEAASYDALQLFSQRARRVKPQFTLTQETMGAVSQIASLVQGSPLGIELAAVWIRMMPPQEIAKELATSIDFLANSSRNAADRHRSLRATFEHSWKLLSPTERSALSNLSVFRGGFTREAAAVIAQAPVAVLAALVDKSLLRVTPEGRYDRHPLLYEYTQEKRALEPKTQSEVQRRHFQYYNRFLAEQQPKMHRVKNSDALFAVEDELENIRVAWRTMLETQSLNELKASCRNLMAYCDGRGQFGLAYELFQEAITQLGSEPPSAFEKSVLSLLLIEQAWCCLSLGRYSEGISLAEKGLSLAYALEEPMLLAKGFNTLGALFRHLGRFAEARALYLKKMKLADYKTHPISKAVDAYNLAAVEYALGNVDKAKQLLHEVLVVSQSLGAQNYLARAKNRLGLYELRAGAPKTALPLLHEALELAHTIGFKRLTPDINLNLANSYTLLGDAAKAQHCIDEALSTAHELGETLEIPAAMSLGKLAYAQAHYPSALAHFKTGIQAAWASKELPYVLSFLACFAEHALEVEKDKVKAFDLLSTVSRHPMSSAHDAQKARKRVAELGASSNKNARKNPEAALAAIIDSLLD